MLSKTKIIFNIGEDSNRTTKGGTKNSRISLDSVEGLRIIIQHKDHHLHRGSLRSSCKVISRPCQQLLNTSTTTFHELSFLKSCFLCKKELKPHMDVYMYRGDQGFCSEDCRHHQILLDERKEYEASIRQRSKIRHHRRGGSKAQKSDNQTRILVLA